MPKDVQTSPPLNYGICTSVFCTALQFKKISPVQSKIGPNFVLPNHLLKKVVFECRFLKHSYIATWVKWQYMVPGI